MAKIEYIPPASAWKLDANTIQSFDGGNCRACRIHGPSRLTRLLTHGGQAPEGQFYGANRVAGSFWFDEYDYWQLRSRAMADLNSQGGGGRPGRLDVYLRLELRSLLAVRRDWSPSFDFRARMTVPAGQSVVAWVGKIRTQPVYSPEFPGSESARKAGLVLSGGLNQFVINFDFPASQAALRWIQEPLPL